MITTQERFNMLFQVKADIKAALENKGRTPNDDFTTYADEIDSMELGHLPTQQIVIEPKASSETYTPDSGYVFDSVTVQAVNSSIDDNLVPSSIRFGKNILGVEGNVQPLSIGLRPSPSHRLVRFYDYDGALLSKQWVVVGQNAVLPETPGHPGLLFQEWNNSHVNITRDTDLCAIYTPSLGRTRVKIEVSSLTGLELNFFFTKSNGANMIILWGDGSEPEVVSHNGVFSVSHTFPQDGEYFIELDISGGTYSLGGGTTATIFVGGSLQYQRDALLEVNLGPNAGIAANGLSGMNSLGLVSIPITVNTIGNSAFSGTRCDFVGLPSSISAIGTGAFQSSATFIKGSLPNGITSIPGNTFYNCSSLRDMVIPSGVSSVGANAFAGAASLEKIEFGESLTSISASAFSGCVRVRNYVLPSPVIVTLANINAFTNINPLAKIYVPDSLVNGYKVATNWAALAEHIKPLSEYGG